MMHPADGRTVAEPHSSSPASGLERVLRALGRGALAQVIARPSLRSPAKKVRPQRRDELTSWGAHAIATR
jgi:hypothetical protein